MKTAGLGLDAGLGLEAGDDADLDGLGGLLRFGSGLDRMKQRAAAGSFLAEVGEKGLNLG